MEALNVDYTLMKTSMHLVGNSEKTNLTRKEGNRKSHNPQVSDRPDTVLRIYGSLNLLGKPGKHGLSPVRVKTALECG